VSTVSRVLNKSIPVDEKTRKRVEEAVQKVNFKPNLLARGLRSKRGHMIGLAVPEILHPSFNLIIKYAEESVRKQGLNLILGNTHNDPEIEENFINSLIQRHIDGIIFSRVSDKSRVLHMIDKTNIPIVVLDRALDVEDIPTVVLNNYRAGELAAEHLISLGHTRIACLAGPLDIALSRERLNGFRDVLHRNNIEFDHNFVFEGNFRYEEGIKAADAILKKKLSITAIWAQSDLMAIGAVEQFRRNGISVPEDLSVIGVDDIEFAKIVHPALTTVAQPFGDMCEKAVDMLIKQSNKEVIDPTRVVMEPILIVRNSTRHV